MSNQEIKSIIQEAVSTSEMRIINIIASIKQDLDKLQNKVEGSITTSLSTIQRDLDNVQSTLEDSILSTGSENIKAILNKGGKHKTRKLRRKN
jgi:F0F1-type ATP synthase membrane subunit b/b'